MTTPREPCGRFSSVLQESLKRGIFMHHTKEKGDLGVAKAYCDLVEKGYLVLFPSTEHTPFDLVTMER
jgi:hypothetical protein